MITSAVIVGGTYAYERFRGKQASSLDSFATAFGVVFIVISLFAEASPELAAGMAALVATSDLLANIPTLMRDAAGTENKDASLDAGISTIQGAAINAAGDVNQIAGTAITGAKRSSGAATAGAAQIGSTALTGIRGAF